MWEIKNRNSEAYVVLELLETDLVELKPKSWVKETSAE